MSRLEVLDATGPWWSPLLAVLLLIAYIAAVWAVLHAVPLLYAAHRRGLARVRAARHTRPRHLTAVRSHVR